MWYKSKGPVGVPAVRAVGGSQVLQVTHVKGATRVELGSVATLLCDELNQGVSVEDARFLRNTMRQELQERIAKREGNADS